MVRNLHIGNSLVVAMLLTGLAGCKSHSSQPAPVQQATISESTYIAPAPPVVPPYKAVVSLGTWDDTGSSNSWPRHLTNARSRLGVLHREMMLAMADAKIKGAAAQSAIVPAIVEFIHASDAVESAIADAQSWGGEDWSHLWDAIETGMDDAHRAVAHAQVVVQRATALPMSDPVPLFFSNQ